MEAPRDDNSVPSWLGISCVDGVTPVPITINPANGGMKVDRVSTISFTPITVAGRDRNSATTKLGHQFGTSSVLPIYVNPVTGAVLIDE